MSSSAIGLDLRVTGSRWGLGEYAIWLPAFSVMLLTTISYIDRNALAILAPVILREAHLTNEQYGFVISAFAIAYMAANPLWGMIVDRVGVRSSLIAAVFLWTLASVSHVFATGFRSLAVARTALGAGEAATYPGAVRTVTQSLPASRRTRGIAIAYSGGSLGAILTPLIVTPIAATWGWRAAFWFTGAVGTLWIVLWAVVSRRNGMPKRPELAKTAGGPRWNDAKLWAFIAADALGSIPLAFVLYQGAVYLGTVLHKSQAEIGSVLWIPPLGWELGFFFWSWVADRSGRGEAPALSVRRRFLLLALLNLPLAFVPHTNSFLWTVALMSLALFITSGSKMTSLTYAIRHYSADHSGLLAGIGSGSWSGAVALSMPLVGRLFDLHRYDMAFAMVALSPLAGFALWRLLDQVNQAR
jgi:ACS family hexuronate transporter-like MFS transporter